MLATSASLRMSGYLVVVGVVVSRPLSGRDRAQGGVMGERGKADKPIEWRGTGDVQRVEAAAVGRRRCSTGRNL